MIGGELRADEGVLPSGARWRGYGRGAPVTLVTHGLGATPGEARIPASGLPGTRVVLTFAGHGDAADPPADYWDYGVLAADVLAAADAVGATRAVGVSLGTGALTRAAAADPGRFERLALLLPAVLDGGREVSSAWALERLAEAVAAAGADGGAALRERVAAEFPPGAQLGDHLAARTSALLRLGPALRALGDRAVVDDAAALRAVRSDVLVLTGTDDPLHPVAAARATAAAIPGSRLEVLPSVAPLFTHRRELRRLLADFLG
ncbi:MULTISPECIES: alpha/beta fold hydrolase [unclassified Saccharopolyspora]|uniref:alpha/beta fold hydrolase n=1 Tax=unclassified Saccharopolyspora TaxID=2646250 RepID=UPI001CD301C4|nr:MULTISPECIES: alpha/beta hydrolase [unclassified Saccharopolyspora]MCA1195633.1 alpha/beta hydrolase [Saccharopolyspora sp. 6V]MCA1283305.1 alpha/beta hydrolase [Saccharopolyspora sp. 7B]